jgi:hypothetical protein
LKIVVHGQDDGIFQQGDVLTHQVKLSFALFVTFKISTNKIHCGADRP